ncbi:MAG: hypothetical protein K0B05_00585 [Bacteroidales bacterium]|nr:hypothetical protein [Bacteroidales bacterium]
MKKIFFLLLISVVILAGCEKEYEKPVITPPGLINVEINKSADVVFAFTAEAGYKTASVIATGGSASVTTMPSAGSTSGSVVVTFSASRESGAGSVVLTLTDVNDNAGQATGVLNVTAVPTISVTQNISSNTTWETGKVYILEGRIAVIDGVTLTIEPGVVIKGREGTGSNATALLVARGGKLIAEGTASSPIIFTSIADLILPGEISSPNLEPTVPGLWGGVLVLGKAPISASSNEMQIEGIPVSDLNGRYGGTDPLDDSGIIKYLSIRHGGANIGEGNEINGLTLGGVGSGTIIENVEVIANDDDGIEWFGGTVNVKNALVWNPQDDAIDTDQSWAGTLDNFIVICGSGTDHALEIDGPEGTMPAAHTVKNGSIKGSLVAEPGDFRDGARGAFENIYFFNFPDPSTSSGRGDLTLSGTATQSNFAAGILSFNNLQITPAPGVALTSIFLNGTHVHATEVTPATRTVGADKSVFAGWTWADAGNQLNDF